MERRFPNSLRSGLSAPHGTNRLSLSAKILKTFYGDKVSTLKIHSIFALGKQLNRKVEDYQDYDS